MRGASFYRMSLCNAESEQGVTQAIIRGVIDFKQDPWPNVSESAKDLVSKMLQADQKLRSTAKQVLGIVLLFPILFNKQIICIL